MSDHRALQQFESDSEDGKSQDSEEKRKIIYERIILNQKQIKKIEARINIK